MVSGLLTLQPLDLPSPRCMDCQGERVNLLNVFFQGVHTLVDCVCASCNSEFYATLPIGASATFTVAFAKDGSRSTYHSRAKLWHAEPLIKSMIEPTQSEGAKIQVQRFSKRKNIVLLNCLDPCFGHSLYRVFHILHLKRSYTELGIVAIITPNFEWLVRDHVAELWIVDQPANRLNDCVPGLDYFVKSQLPRFEKVSLSRASFSNPHGSINLYDIIPSQPFPLYRYALLPFRIVFVLREDRFWLRSKILNFIFFASVKFKMKKLARPLLAWRQNQLYARVAKRIKKQCPQVELYAVGLGKAGKLNPNMQDHRLQTMTEQDELRWLRLYAQSQLVIGVHGSNMILPTSLSAGFIEILPRYKIDHLAEDTALVHPPIKLQGYLGRYLDEGASPSLIATHAISMWRGTELKWRSTQESYD